MHKITTKTRSKPRWVSTQGTKNKNNKQKEKNSYFLWSQVMQKAKRIRTRRVLDVVANDGGHDDGVADSTPPFPCPRCTHSPWGRGSDFALLFLVRDKTLFSFVSFAFFLCSLVDIRIRIRDGARHETCSTYWDYTVAQNSSFGARLSRLDFIDFLHAPCGNVWQTRNTLQLQQISIRYSPFWYSLFVLFVLALVLHIRIE